MSAYSENSAIHNRQDHSGTSGRWKTPTYHDCSRRFADYVESGNEPAALQRARVAGTLAPA